MSLISYMAKTHIPNCEADDYTVLNRWIVIKDFFSAINDDYETTGFSNKHSEAVTCGSKVVCFCAV